MGQTLGESTHIKAHNQAANWTHNRVPANGASIKFATNAVQDLTLQDNYILGEVDFNGNDKNIVIGNYNLNVESFKNRNTNIVKTTGTGKLKMKVLSGQTITFPIANATNNFLLITNNALTEEEYSVRVLNGVLAQGTIGSEASGSRINRTWDIHKESSNSSTNINLEYHYNDNEVLDYTGNERFKMYHYLNNQWVVEKAHPNDSSSNYVKFNNYTGTFSPFGIGDGIGGVLPVELTYLNSICIDKNIQINWATASENNSDYFKLIGSRDGIYWETIPEKIEAAHYSNQTIEYSFELTYQYSYVKLLQIDIDGKEKIYGPINTNCSNEIITVFPNPAKTDGYIEIDSQKTQSCQIQIINSIGNSEYSESIQLLPGKNLKFIDTNNFNSGIYFISFDLNGKKEIIKWVIQH
jgi:hypothetical protein